MRSASSPRPCSWDSKPAWPFIWRARNCRSCSGSKARRATSGSARPISSHMWATRIAKSLLVGVIALIGAGRRQALAQEPPGGVSRGGGRHTRGPSHGPRCARRGVARRSAARPALPRFAGREPARSERAATDRAGRLRPRRRRDVRHRPDVRPEARLSVRREPGAAGHWRGQSALGTRPRVPGERRDVAVARQRKCRRANTGVRPHRCPLHHDRRAVCVGIAAEPAATGAGGHRARGGDGPRRRSARSSTSGDSVERSSWSPSRRCSACLARAPSTAC